MGEAEIRLDLFRLRPLRAGSAARVTVDSLTFLDTTFLHATVRRPEQCTHDRGTRAYFFGKLFEIES